MRKLRSDIQYRRRDIANDYLERNISTIKEIIEILFDIINKEIKEF
jgi:hypothetical protein